MYLLVSLLVVLFHHLQPDPQTTRFITSKFINIIYSFRSIINISSQVKSLNNSLGAIKDNLAISDQLERQREAAKQKREAILAEQGLREGKESQIRKKNTISITYTS